MRRSAILSATAALLAAVAFTAPAGATPPLVEQLTDSGADIQACDGFDVVVSRDFTGTVTTFFAQDGTPVRIQVRAHMEGTAVNTDTGETLDLRGSILLVIDLVTGSTSFTGQVFMANEKGKGSVVRDTGNFVFDADGNLWLDAGPHDVVDTNGEVFCAALA